MQTLTSSAGDYEPLPYALPGIALRAAHGAGSADRWGRLASLLPCLAFVVLAFSLLWDRRDGTSLLGMFVAVTPMVVFVAASLTPSGLEICSGIAFAALLLRMTRGETLPARFWLTFAMVGCVLALSRTTGAVWVVLDFLLCALLVERRRLGVLFRGNGPRAATAAVIAAIALNRIWELVYGSTLTSAGVDSGGFLNAVPHGIRQLPRLFNESVGVFGWLDASMPVSVYRAWLLLVGVLVLTALLVGSRRERLSLCGALVSAGVVAVALSASLESSTGMDVQGRHLLGFSVLTPLLSSEIVYRHRERLGNAMFAYVGCAAVMAGATQVVALLYNGRRQAVGASHSFGAFFSAPNWSPPLGWLTWISVCAAGALLITVAGILPWVNRQGM